MKYQLNQNLKRPLKSSQFNNQLENNKLVTYSDEKDLILWDINEPESIYKIKGHTKPVKGLCLIEGNKFVTVSSDNTLKIWE